MRGYAYPINFTNYVNENNYGLDLVSDNILNFEKLLLNRIDYAIIDKLNAQYILKTFTKKGIIILPKSVESIQLYFIFNNNTDDKVVEQFNITLKEFKKTEEYKKILNKYLSN